MASVVQDRLDDVIGTGADLITQEELQLVVRFALVVDRIVVAGEGVAGHSGSLATTERLTVRPW